jgi:AcrR family transcriptional regulator
MAREAVEQGDELWPPFGPGAAFWRPAGRPGPDSGHQAPRGRPGPESDQPRPRGRERHRPVLSRDDIVAAAIGVADQYGSDAVSMRRVAQVLRAGAMSLYWHLASKEHLLELMLDAILAEVYVPDPTGDWRADVRAQACSTRAVLLRHRWVVDFFSARPPLGPNTLRNLDKMLGALDGLGIDTGMAINILQSVNTYVSGAVIREFQEIRNQHEQEEFADADQQFFLKLDEWKRRLAGSGKFDHFIRMLDDGIDPDAPDTRDERFEFGLDCLLEGIAARLGAGPAS